MFGDHRHCASEDKMLLICHLTSCDHTFKGLCEFISGSNDLAMFGGHWSSTGGVIKYLSRDHKKPRD